MKKPYWKDRYQKRIEKGLCSACGVEKPREGYKSCLKCADRWKAKERVRKEKRAALEAASPEGKVTRKYTKRVPSLPAFTMGALILEIENFRNGLGGDLLLTEYESKRAQFIVKITQILKEV